jgi:hypothetical protein
LQNYIFSCEKSHSSALPTCDPPKYIRVGAEQLGFDFVKQCPGEKERPSGTMPRWPFVGAWNTPRSVSHGPSSLCPQDVLRTPFLACAALPRLAVAAAAGPNSLVQTPCGSQRAPGPPALLLSLAQSPSRRHYCRRCQALTPTVSVLTCARGPSAGSYFLLALASPGARAPAPSLAVSQGSVPAQTSWASSGEVPLARWPAVIYHTPRLNNWSGARELHPELAVYKTAVFLLHQRPRCRICYFSSSSFQRVVCRFAESSPPH